MAVKTQVCQMCTRSMIESRGYHYCRRCDMAGKGSGNVLPSAEIVDNEEQEENEN